MSVLYGEQNIKIDGSDLLILLNLLPDQLSYFLSFFPPICDQLSLQYQNCVVGVAETPVEAMPTNEGFSGVSNCYVFKSRLQEYAQKAGLSTPEYETIKEGPSHEPSFKSTVIVNSVRYDSLPGFFNRKAAEQSAAEVALSELAKSGEVNQCLSQPVHETGLCKNLLQEYAQKMNFAIPLYQCQKDNAPGREALFKCTVEIGGIRYIGASARTKKEAEIKAARTALLAIWSSSSESSDRLVENARLTVLPGKKRGAEAVGNSEESAKVSKVKKARFKKKMKMQKKRLSGKKVRNTRAEIEGGSDVKKSGQAGSESNDDKKSGILVAFSGPLAQAAIGNPECEGINDDNNETTELPMPGELLAPHVTTDLVNGSTVTVLSQLEEKIEAASTQVDFGNWFCS